MNSSGAVQLSCLEILSDSDFNSMVDDCNVRTVGDSVLLENMGTQPTSGLELACDTYARLGQSRFYVLMIQARHLLLPIST
jgi:hypothetical protein